MGTLRDEAYEKLDYLSKLTEVVVSPQNDVLAKIPDRTQLTFDQINNIKQSYWSNHEQFELSIYTLFYSLLERKDYEYVNELEPCFSFEFSDDFEIDFANSTMTGTVHLVKNIQQVDEKKILETSVQRAGYLLSHFRWPNKRLKDKVCTVLNTLEPGRGTEWAKKLQGRVSWAAQRTIQFTLNEIILENKWRVRDASTIVKMGEWINSYLSDETDTSTGLVNLIKLKIMIDKDLPVYSVDEVNNVNDTRTSS